jgi:hypothetical protein
MVADDVQSLCPVIHAPKIRGVNPFFPESRGVSPGIEISRPLQKPQDINAVPGIVNRPPGDGFKRKGADLHFDRNRHPVYLRAYVGAVRSERTFQRDVSDIGFFLEREKDFHFAAPVFVAFIFGIQARERVDVGKMIHRASAGLQNDFIAAIRTFEWGKCFRRKIRGDDLACEFSLCGKYRRRANILT